MEIVFENKKLSRVFSATFLIGLTKGNNIELFIDIFKNSKLFDLNTTDKLTIKDILDKYYFQLLKSYKNEYVYKNLLIKYIKSSDENKPFSLISEMDVGIDSRIDMALFSKTNTAYEIKTELDTLSRLDKQLTDYAKGFEYTWVLTNEKKVEKLSSKLDNRVGIKFLDKNNKIQQYKSAKSNMDLITHAGLFSILRQKEFFQLLKRHYGHISYNNTIEARNKLIDMFKSIDIIIAHQYTVDIIKYRTHHSKLVKLLNKMPSSLLPIGLNSAIQKDSSHFFKFINSSINELNNHMDMMQHRKLF